MSKNPNGVSVAGDFVITYPTSKTANINAGNSQITLTPVKGNNNFEGSGEFNFVITPATLEKDTGSLKIYNDRNEELTGQQSFKYDGTAHILVVAKGNYKAAGTYTDVNGNKIENVVIEKHFRLKSLLLKQKTLQFLMVLIKVDTMLNPK